MTNSTLLITTTKALGFLALISVVFSFLALTDIYQNTEPNLDLEWDIVKAGLACMLAFVVLALLTLFRIRSH